MGIQPVGKLLAGMAIPMMISMLVQAFYNIVDSIFVAQLSEDALNAVSLAFPLQNLMIAFGAGTAVGINALLSRSLGEKNQAMADRAANTGIFLSLCSFVAFALIGIFLSRPSSRSRPPASRSSWSTAPSTPPSAWDCLSASSASSALSGCCSPPAGPPWPWALS